MNWRWLPSRPKCFLKQIVAAAGLALPFLTLTARPSAQIATNAPQFVLPAQAKPGAHGDLKDLQFSGGLLSADYTGFSGATCTSCHGESGAKNGSISISGVPASYVPGTAYGLTVTVSDPGQSKWGFQMSARRQAATTQAGGSFSNTTGFTQTVTIGGIPFITQTTSGARTGTANSVTYNFNWIAPSAGAGTVQFNVAGLAANNNSSISGDFTYTTSATSSQLLPPSAPTNLQTSAVSNVQINLTWNNVANETGYRIERKTGTGGTFAEIATVGANATSFPSTGLSANTTYCYRVRAFNDAGNSGYSNESCTTTSRTGVEAPALADLPAAFELGQNYPNPFGSVATSPAQSGGNPSTIIKFALPQAAHVTLAIYNLLGKKVAVLVNEQLPAGRHEKQWQARDPYGRSLPSGVYLYRLQSGRFSQTKKLVLMQ